MALGWKDFWIAYGSLLATAVCIVMFSRWAWMAKWPPALRWMLASVVATGTNLVFAYSDHTHPRSPPDAYVIAMGQCAVVVAGAALVGLINYGRRPRSAGDRGQA